MYPLHSILNTHLKIPCYYFCYRLSSTIQPPAWSFVVIVANYHHVPCHVMYTHVTPYVANYNVTFPCLIMLGYLCMLNYKTSALSIYLLLCMSHLSRMNGTVYL
ncbi:hypothetical protein BJX70DRAFT_248456 [Aspergillus crustosus]